MMFSAFTKRTIFLFIFFLTGCAQLKPVIDQLDTITGTNNTAVSKNAQESNQTQNASDPSKATANQRQSNKIASGNSETNQSNSNEILSKDEVLNSEEMVIPATDQPDSVPDDETSSIPINPDFSDDTPPENAKEMMSQLVDMMPVTAMREPDKTADNQPSLSLFPLLGSPDIKGIYNSPCYDIDCSADTKSNVDIGQSEDSPNTATAQQSDLWDRLRKGYKIPNKNINRRTQAQLDWYASHNEYLQRTFNRAQNYLYYIVTQLEKRHMPTELALLPVVESAFDPFAYSHGRASGMWQFIPSTGRIFGLKQNWWYDGRRDITASTNAALDYLQALADRFNGHWLLALAAYNSGAGTVLKAIKRNKARGRKTDFWSLHLPLETSAYAPKLMAIAKIIESPTKYGIDLKSIPNKPTFEQLDIGGQMDLAQAAKLADIKIETLYRFNPGFNRWATSPQGPHKLLIPIQHANDFKHAIAKLSNKDRLTWRRYKIRSGDSLIRIAKHFNTTPDVIRHVNNLHSNQIRVGHHLLIPVASRGNHYYKLNSNNRLLAKQKFYGDKHSTSKIVHKVRSGDTLWDLSRKYHVGVRSIAKWNGMAPGDPLRPGKKIVIWSKSWALTAKKDTRARLSRKTLIRKIGYRVRSGDSLAKIAEKFNLKVNQIAMWNNLNRKRYLQPGQHLTLYVDLTDGS
jgi:membrane-bound lytic murein transglycosylase D